MERDPLLQHFVHELEGPAWIAKRVEVLPGVVDSEIIHVTPAMDRLYGYVWPDTLVGHHLSTTHVFDEAQIIRQYAVLRHWGFPAPRDYVIRGLHPNGRSFRVIKHVTQYTLDTLSVWVTRHEPWHRSTAYPAVKPLPLPALPSEDVRAFVGDISIAHLHHVGPLLHDTASLERLRARLRLIRAAMETPTAPAAASQTTLGHQLRHARHTQRLSQQALAQRCTVLLGRRVTPQYLSNLEHGARVPSVPLLRALATVLALEPATVGAALLGVRPPETPMRPLSDTPPSQDLLAHVRDAVRHRHEAQHSYQTALRTAYHGGVSLRQLATVTGFSPSRIRQLVVPALQEPAPRLRHEC